ncbi:hypothetical protein K1F50_20820 [Muricauda oceani]|uniref:DUF4252 domain-containing protein n=1 Tax=Flagellimonas oceani TaxID=2698672 RepID=A0A6G7J6H6_9FLAO|nr:hypothetical protein [Allomuricauda oceani]MBW8245253.1 hypothetical protein [Allomuricauda oceani]QII46435.1 hypothetical protein GVT53_17680 [Allomuricauda oceani]
MKGITYLICAVAILFSLNCKSTSGIQNITLEQSEVINAYFENRKEKKLFFKSLVKPSSSSTLVDLINYSELNSSHDIIEKKFGVEFRKIFDKEEMIRLKRKAQAVEKISFNKGMFDNITISKKHDFNTLTLSVPILSNDGEYALIYVESTGGGDLIVFKKIDEKWKANYVLSDWIS